MKEVCEIIQMGNTLIEENYPKKMIMWFGQREKHIYS